MPSRGTENIANTGTFAIQDTTLAGVIETTGSPARSAVRVTLVPATNEGLTPDIRQALTTSAQIKSTAGKVYGFSVYNPANATVYIFYYNQTTSPTIGSTLNLLYQTALPTLTSAHI